ncbi:MAG: hypothetical protein HY782_01300 [Chloroflexi bacterium]|nr:hypothetical protein [Chloroflexota bacterium]
MISTEERVDQLEAVVGQLATQMTQVNAAILRLKRANKEPTLQAERGRQAEETTRQEMEERWEKERQEARQERRKLACKLAEDSIRRGTLVEDVIAPTLRRMVEEQFDLGEPELFVEWVESYHPVTRQRHDFEVIAVGKKAALINETRTTARLDRVKEVVQFLQSGQFFEHFPEYAGKSLIPVFSSLYIHEDILTYLTEQGIYALGMGDETMQVLNLEQVRAARSE